MSKLPLSDDDLRKLIADRKNDPDVPNSKDWASSDFWNNPDNPRRIQIRKREKTLNRASKEHDIDFS